MLRSRLSGFSLFVGFVAAIFRFVLHETSSAVNRNDQTRHISFVLLVSFGFVLDMISRRLITSLRLTELIRVVTNRLVAPVSSLPFSNFLVFLFFSSFRLIRCSLPPAWMMSQPKTKKPKTLCFFGLSFHFVKRKPKEGWIAARRSLPKNQKVVVASIPAH